MWQNASESLGPRLIFGGKRTPLSLNLLSYLLLFCGGTLKKLTPGQLLKSRLPMNPKTLDFERLEEFRHRASVRRLSYLTKHDLAWCLGIGLTTLREWRLFKYRDFPEPLPSCLPRCIWKLSTVDRWITKQVTGEELEPYGSGLLFTDE